MTDRTVKISVRNLVEFLLRSGDIDNRRQAGSDNAMAEGGRIHRMIQRRMGSEYAAEVSLKYEEETTKYRLIIEGRADGILTTQEQVLIDEIKGTYRELDRISKPDEVHLAQARVYAYLYAKKNQLDSIGVRMTYCNMDTEELKYFHSEYTLEELEEWFFGLVSEYKIWAEFQVDWREKRQESIRSLHFPYTYRKGQKELAANVYRTIYHKRKLFLEAPTGVGKTLSTVFPSVKALGEELGERIFYLTAKTITRTAAQQAFSLLREQGLCFKTVILTAKEKLCFLEECSCNPLDCPYAKGHFDRINAAVFALISQEDNWDRKTIEAYAGKHQVCPVELTLDSSLFADGIIGDYNYLFDPHIYLKRFFAEGNHSKGIFLVDECHNLVERGREMYSAAVIKEEFQEIKKLIKPYSVRLEKQLAKCDRELLRLKKQTEGVKKWQSIEAFAAAMDRLISVISEYLENHDDSPVRERLLEFYFLISHFMLMYDGMQEDYVIYTQMTEEGNFLLKLFCVNPARNLRACMEKGVSSILFSATLLPVQYYKQLLGGQPEDYEVYAASHFDSSHRALLIGEDVTSRYTRRNENEYMRMASYLDQVVSVRRGNYMVFFPSYAMMERVEEIYQKFFNAGERVECICQKESMSEEEREDFLKHFTGNPTLDLPQNIGMPMEKEERSLLGFCVMGGIFSEGIDLKQDSLIGVIVVGTGLPQICTQREILREYFDRTEGTGFDYAYRYPGMNKVLQAAGRVIRTDEDIGVVVLLDERFLESSYLRLFPREWKEYQVVQADNVGTSVKNFWKSQIYLKPF